MTRLLRTTACALVSSLLLLLPAAHATHHSKANAGVADIDDKHGGKLRQKNFRVREVRFSPFIVHNSTELNRALAVLEHESQKCNDFGRNKHDDFDSLGDVTDKRSGLRARGADFSGNQHGDHKNKGVEQDEERCFGRILLAKGKKYQLEREFIFADAFKLDLEGRPGATIRAAPGKRHLTFDDQAVLSAHQVAFVDGGCDKEGFVGGSILVVNRASIITRGVNWTNNHAWSGGAIFADDAKRVNVFHAVFKDNSADKKGGAVAIREARQDRTRKGKQGKHGSDNSVGAASGRNNKNKNAVNDAAIRRKEAEERRRKKQQELAAARNKNKNGGALATATGDDKHGKKQRGARQRRGTKAKFIRVKFVRNSANKGGALSNSGSHTEVEDCFFAKNKAHVGGAIFNNKRGRLLVRETAFVRNKASAKGGAIFNDGWLWIVCSAFVDNKAPLGADIFNNGWLKCTSDTIPVHIDGKGSGYCTPCTPPQTPAPTVRSTPMRKIKKKVVIENKKNKHGDSDNKGRGGGLFGGVFGGNNNNKNKGGKDKGDDTQAETVVFYDYYRHGEGNAYDRWNGYNSALVDEEDFDDFKTGYGYGSYGVGGAFDFKDDFKDKFDDKDKFGKGKDDSYYGKDDYGYGHDEDYGDDDGYYGEESDDVYYGSEDDYYGGDEEGAYGYGGSDIYY